MWLDQTAEHKSLCDRLCDAVYAVHLACWENIMAGPKTDLQALLGAADSFSAADSYGDRADAQGRDEPGQINQ